MLFKDKSFGYELMLYDMKGLLVFGSKFLKDLLEFEIIYVYDNVWVFWEIF